MFLLLICETEDTAKNRKIGKQNMNLKEITRR